MPTPPIPVRRELLELLTLVREMRALQRAWFGGDKRPATLGAARLAERAVDRALARFDEPESAQLTIGEEP